MEDLAINWMAIIVAAVASLAMGFIWFHPKVFGKMWAESVGMTDDDMKNPPKPWIFIIAVILAVLLAFYLAVSVTAHHDIAVDGNFGHGAFHGAFLVLLVGLPMMATNAMFERRGLKYVFTSVGFWVATAAVMGGIVSAWH